MALVLAVALATTTKAGTVVAAASVAAAVAEALVAPKAVYPAAEEARERYEEVEGRKWGAGMGQCAAQQLVATTARRLLTRHSVRQCG